MGNTGVAICVDDVGGQGGGGSCVEVCELADDDSMFEASGISSDFGESGLGLVASSASCISTSGEGAGVGSFAGIVSFPVTIAASSVLAVTCIADSSTGGDGAGEGLFDVTSLSAGERASAFTDADADRLRSRYCLSSAACCSSFFVKDIGRLITLVLVVEDDAGATTDLSSPVCVELST